MITRIDHDDLFIAGSFVRASATKRFSAVSPATEEIVGTVPVANAADVDHAVSAARTAFDSWSRTAVQLRSSGSAGAARSSAPLSARGAVDCCRQAPGAMPWWRRKAAANA